MPYPDSPTVDELSNHPDLRRELCSAFNAKPKDGVKLIKDIAARNGLNDSQQNAEVAKFLLNNPGNLDKLSMADYLGSNGPENVAILKQFAGQQTAGFAGKEFMTAYRSYLDTLAPRVEGQKIERLANAFGEAYVEANPEGNLSLDQATKLANTVFFMSTSIHNPQVSDRIGMESFVNLMRPMKDEKVEPFDREVLENFYRDIEQDPILVSFDKVESRYELDSDQLKTDLKFAALDRELGKKQFNDANVFDIEGAKVEVSQRKGFFARLTGYKSTVTITGEDGSKVSVEVNKPGFFSRKKPTVTVKPGEGEGSAGLAAKIAGKFNAKAEPVASFDYERNDMTKRVANIKQGKEVDDGITKPVLKAGVKAPKEDVGVEGVGEGVGEKLPKEGVKDLGAPKEGAKVEVDELGDLMKEFQKLTPQEQRQFRERSASIGPSDQDIDKLLSDLDTDVVQEEGHEVEGEKPEELDDLLKEFQKLTPEDQIQFRERSGSIGPSDEDINQLLSELDTDVGQEIEGDDHAIKEGGPKLDRHESVRDVMNSQRKSQKVEGPKNGQKVGGHGV